LNRRLADCGAHRNKPPDVRVVTHEVRMHVHDKLIFEDIGRQIDADLRIRDGISRNWSISDDPSCFPALSCGAPLLFAAAVSPCRSPYTSL
jgi:hypothetical protein